MTETTETTDEALADGAAVTELDPEAEVALRSADQSDKPTSEHRKIFVLGPDPSSPTANPYTEAKGYDHEPNKAATRQYAIDQGLWPTGDVRFVSGKRHADGVSWELTYAVPVEPAHNVPTESPNPEVIADDTDNDGATKATNADA
jgi:hypothetical protein